MTGTGLSGINGTPFSENNAAKSGFKIEKGYELMEYFIRS